jgi:hypothetical protein
MTEENLKEILTNYKNKSNKDLVSAMDFLNEDFENTKTLIVKLTHHLDGTERAYNKILNEYQNRVK